tara:strand:+ start:851 stop:1561 length:711 start_codon:yes stop_codon:yes gene_type:complete
MAYQTGRIYKIICLSKPDIQYVGSTFKTLRYRWNKHNGQYKEWLISGEKRGCSIFKFFKERGIKDFKIVLLKEYKVCSENNKDRKHLNIYEQLWINKINCCNINNTFTAPFLQKEYREKNKEKIAKQKKEYREKNKELIKTKDKIYNEKNKEKISLRKKEKIECGNCSSMVTRHYISEHRRSKKCMLGKPDSIENKEDRRNKIECDTCGDYVKQHSMNRHKISQKCKTKSCLKEKN